MSPLLRVSGKRPKRPKRTPRSARLQFPDAAEQHYVAELEGYVRSMHTETMRRLRPLLAKVATALAPVPTIAVGAQRTMPARLDALARRLDSAADDIAEVFDELKRVRVEWDKSEPVGQLELFTRTAGQEVATLGKVALAKQIKALSGLDPLFGDPTLAARLSLFNKANVDLIRSIDARYFSEIEGVMTRGLAAGTRPETLTKQLQERYEVSESRARLIARDQIGKLHGQIVQARNEELGITHYTWMTSDDERVRESHAERDGQRYAWDDPPGDMSDPADGGHPGTPIGCRCTSAPDIDDLLTRLEAE